MQGYMTIPKKGYGDSDWDDAPADLETIKTAKCTQAEHQIVWGGNYFDLGPARCFLV